LLWKRRAARLRGEGPPYSFEIKALRKSGEPFEAAVLGTPIDYEGDKAVLAFVIDMSVEKQLRSQLQQAQKMEALGTLAGGIAHDFNNILSAIIGYTELAKQGISPGGTVEEDLDRVLKSAERAKNLVKQILTFSRRTDEEQKPLQPVLIVKEALKLLRASVPKNVRFEEVIDPLTGIIAADPTRIHQIMMNLCTNAVQAMLETDTEGVLGVRLGNEDLDEAKAWYMDLSPGSYVKLTVTDTGPGISEDDLARIFEPYFTTKAKGEGTGLGLSVVQGIVEAYGGRVLVESLPGKGTTFHVLFPRIEQVIDAAENVENELQFSTGTEHILFVDDEPPLVDIGKRILERLGYRVTALTSGREALSCFAEAPADFDLVVTDLAMPDMAGDKLIRELVALRPDIPVILCSGFFEDANKERLSELGVSAFIGKPLTAQDLSQSIRRALDQ
jgi:signal transduction histidine kinase/CheY-like chemotaxis protein